MNDAEERVESFIIECARKAILNDNSLGGEPTETALKNIVENEVLRLGMTDEKVYWQCDLRITKRFCAWGLLRYAEGVAAGISIAKERAE